jgi:GMP reductase
MNTTHYSYDDITLLPSYFGGTSRSKIDTSVKFGEKTFKLPVVPANMACCIGRTLAKSLADEGYFYIMHRFGKNYYHDVYHWLNNKCMPYYSISIGVQKEDFTLLDALYSKDLIPEYITVDIAHGHCRKMKEMLEVLGKFKKAGSFIIAGNVGSPDAVNSLYSWGADCVKVGVGPGAACTTRLKTGFHTPMTSLVGACCSVRDKYDTDFLFGIPEIKPEKKYIIADGGVRHNGDFAKALACGADMVMAGSIFSACKDSPAESVYGKVPSEHQTYGGKLTQETIQLYAPIIQKKYYGSASAKNKGHNNNIEGKEVVLDCNGLTCAEKLLEIQQDLQSACSYAGGSLEDLKRVSVGYLK